MKPIELICRRAGEAGRARAFGPYEIEPLIDDHEEGAGTVYRVRIGPGCRTRASYHKLAEEYYYVLSGRGTAFLDGAPKPLEPGVFLRLPPGTSHGFETGDEPLELLNVHTPGCRPNRDVYFLDGLPMPPEGTPA